jgi:hypothetical protein
LEQVDVVDQFDDLFIGLVGSIQVSGDKAVVRFKDEAEVEG